MTKAKAMTVLGLIVAVASAALGFSDLIGPSLAFWAGVAGVAASAAGGALAKVTGRGWVTWLGVGVAVVGAVGPELAKANEKWGRVALFVGAIIAALGKGLGGGNSVGEPNPPGASGFVQGLAFVLVPALALGLSGCGKDDLAKGLRKAVISADFALKTAENAYQTGFLTYEQRRATFEVGRDLNATLTEANDFVATLPEEIIEGKQPIAAADKARLLAIFDEGVRRANRLVDNGNWIRDEKGREEYLKFARPVAAGLASARRIAEALKVKPPPVPMPEPSPPFLDISRVFVA